MDKSCSNFYPANYSVFNGICLDLGNYTLIQLCLTI